MYIKLSVVYDKPKAGQNKNEGKFRGKKGGGGGRRTRNVVSADDCQASTKSYV